MFSFSCFLYSHFRSKCDPVIDMQEMLCSVTNMERELKLVRCVIDYFYGFYEKNLKILIFSVSREKI